MCLHATVQLLSLLRLVHLRIMRLFLILDRTWYMNECCIYHRTFGNQKPLSLKMNMDHFQQYRRQFMLLQKMTEIQYRGLVRQGIDYTEKSRKAPHTSISYRLSSICRLDRLNQFCMQ